MKIRIALLLITIAVFLVGYAYPKHFGTNGGRSEYDYHDNGNVELKVWRTPDEGDIDFDGGWIYPRVDGIPYLYTSTMWFGGWGCVTEDWHNLLGVWMSDDAEWPDDIPVFADLDSYVLCDDSDEGDAGPLGISVERHGYSFTAPPKDDFIGFQYKIYNQHGQDLNGVYISRPCDFDIGGETSYLDDLVGHDSSRDIPYMYDEEAEHGYIGVICPQGTPLGSKVWDIMSDPEDDETKFAYMTNDTWETADTPNDWRVMYNTGPYTIPADGHITVAFITVSGDDLADLQANADVAMDSYPDDTGTVNIVPSSVGRVKALYR
jgi:hypothetical protein